MRKIINKVLYDTNQAALIGHYDNIGRGVDSTSDFNFWEANLYRTPRSGRYFLAGGGNAMSQYATYSGIDSWGGGERIDPMTRDEAYAWAEKYLSAELVEQEFPNMITEA